MRVTVSGRNVDVGEALKNHVEGDLPGAVEKYFSDAKQAEVTFGKEKGFFVAELQVHLGHRFVAHAHGRGRDAHMAFSEALEHIAKKIRRHKRRLSAHPRTKDEEKIKQARQFIFDPDVEEEVEDKPESPPTDLSPPAIIAEMEAEIPSLSVRDAVMQMDFSGQNALMFENRATGRLNMVYFRNDGHVGWVEPH